MAPSSPHPPHVPGHRVVHRDAVPSTNRTARDGIASGEFTAGTIVVADAQTEGRGRRGRSWVTLPGRALAASFVVRPPAGLVRPARLSLLAGVAAPQSRSSWVRLRYA